MTEHASHDIGAGLRLAREQSGLSLRQIADVTKLPLRSLEALERNRIAQLPGGIYRRAIVRSYAAQIGLDPEQTLQTFLAQYPDDVPTIPAAEPASQPDRPVLRAALRLLSAIVPIFAAVVYVGYAARLAPAESAATGGRQALASDAARRQNSAVAVAADERAADSRVAGSIPMMISVSSSTNLAVLADGDEVVARRFDAGETLRVEFRNDVKLHGDDGAAVRFSINGRAGRALGESGRPLNVLVTRNEYQNWLLEP